MGRSLLVLSPRARLVVEQCAHYLVDHGSLAVAMRFLECLEETCNLLLDRPGFGRQLPMKTPELVGVRSYRVQGFDSHLVFYLQREGGIEVLRVLHGARDLEAILGDPESVTE